MSVVIDSMTQTSTWTTALWNVTPSSPSWTGWGQQFQGNGDTVTEVQWYGYKQAASGGGTLVCKIYASLAAVQADTPLATSNEINYNNLPSSAGWFSFTFPTPFSTASGQKYFIVIKGGATLGTSYAEIYYSGASRLDFEVLGREYGNWSTLHNSSSGNSLMFKVLGTTSGGGGGSSFFVMYNGNGNTGGSAPTDSNSPYNSGSLVSVLGQNTLVKTNWVFKGWNTNQANANSGIVQYTQGQTFNITGSTTLYAVWHATYTVVYNANRPAGASGTGSVPTNSNRYEQNASVPVTYNNGNLTTANYTFLGWHRNSSALSPEFTVNGTSVSPSTFSMGTTDTTLYAIWNPNSGGGGGSGGGFDGGTINNPLEIKCKFPSLLEVWSDVSSWMNNAPVNPSAYDAYLRFTNKNPSPVLSTDIYGIAFNDGNTDVAGIGINDSLLVRKNLYAKKAGIGTIEVPTLLQVDSVKSFTEQPIKLDGQIVLKNTIEEDNRITQEDIVKSLWGFSDGTWYTTNFEDVKRCGSWITFTDADPPTSASGLNLFRIHTTGGSPLLAVDRGMVIKKDLSIGGFVAANQGVLQLGSGLNNQLDVPKIVLVHSDVSMLDGKPDFTPAIPQGQAGTSFPSAPTSDTHYLRTDANPQYNNRVFKYLGSGWADTTPDIGSKQLFRVTNSFLNQPADTIFESNYNKNTSKWEWIIVGPASNYAGKTFDTLYIRKGAANDIPGNLDAGDVSAHGHLDCQDLTVRGNLHVEGNTTTDGSGFKAGHAWTSAGNPGDEARGCRTIHFKPTAFKNPPVVTVTVQDQNNGSNIPYIAKIIDIDKDHFKVQTFYVKDVAHDHHIGFVSAGEERTVWHDTQTNPPANTQSNSNNVKVPASKVAIRNASGRQDNVDTLSDNMGFFVQNNAGVLARNMYTRVFNQLEGQNAKADSSYEPFSCEFMWIAVEKSQADPPANTPG